MPSSEDARPPMHFGDYPNGAYWSAERRTGTDDDPVNHAASGSVIRFMWDYSVRIPLWGTRGLLPQESEWLREALGLSDPLIEDLRSWGLAMDALDGDPSRRTTEAYEALDASARALVQRLEEEIGPQFRVDYQPW